jgi:phytoene dehydrogenase-like protein
MSNQYDYDAIIIGAGISGLVCGCYLAKAGMKVLIVEKNAKPGGYCTSFTRKGFTFDACAHSLGSLREGGNIAGILEELGLDKKINIIRYDPSDIIIDANYRVSFWNDLKKTIYEFQKNFPQEAKKIEQFFNYLNNNWGTTLLAELRNKTFKDLIDSYFKDFKLKAILSLPILGNVGLPPSLASAITAVTIYKEYIYDGGNYPEKGMQELPNLFVKKLKELGADVLLAKMVNKIRIKDGNVKGVVLWDGNFISAKYVISNVDARYTFLKMIGNGSIEKNMLDSLNSMTPSLSMFILYLGIDQDFDGLPKTSANMWFLPHYDIERMYLTAISGDVDNSDWFLFRASKEKRNILMLVNASFNTEYYWEKNKYRLTDLFIKKIEQVVPELSRHVVFKDSATPHTLYKYTLNDNGAAYGWAGTPSQFAVPGFTQITFIKNLYLTGHWTTLAQGISGVSYLGRSTARIILNKEKYKK